MTINDDLSNNLGNTNRGLDASQFDCGDGVPAFTFIDGHQAETGTVGIATRPDRKPATNAMISVRMFAIGASIITQLIIGVGVALGGNPFVGLVAAITVMTCALTLVIAEATKDL